MSERRACQLANQPRGTQRYQPTQRDDEDALLTVTTSNVDDESGGFGIKAGTAPSGAIDIVFGVQGQDNDDVASRMVKALTHARDLCKASYKPHPGEPF